MSRYFSAWLGTQFLLCLTLLAACSQPSNPNNSRAATGYFDLKAFVENVSKDLAQNKNCKVVKTLQLKGQAERLLNPEVDWDKEFTFFKEADLNKPVFAGQYVSQTNGATENLTPLNNDIGKVKKMVIEREGEAVKSLFVLYSDSNYLYNIHRELSMKLEGGKLVSYSIKADKKLLFQQPFSLHVEGSLDCQ
jgi:hypothetical protein